MNQHEIKLKRSVLSEGDVDTLNLKFNTEVSFMLTTGGQFTIYSCLSPVEFVSVYNSRHKSITLLCGNKTYCTIKKKHVACFYATPATSA